MENFFSYISKPVSDEELQFWVDSNDICYQKLELFEDFTKSLVLLIYKTYLGDTEGQETNISITEEDNLKHFEWCWNKNIENFNKEGVYFGENGDHKEFVQSFFEETFYNQKIKEVKMSLNKFFDEVFNLDKLPTKSDLDLLTSIYKTLDKSLKVSLQ
jgi:hypothetical protein